MAKMTNLNKMMFYLTGKNLAYSIQPKKLSSETKVKWTTYLLIQ